MRIRMAIRSDAAGIAAIILPVIREGATYAIDPELSDEAGLAYWLGADKTTFVVEDDGVLLGTYFIRTNQPGGGQHVCNCGYMTSPRRAFQTRPNTKRAARSAPCRSSATSART